MRPRYVIDTNLLVLLVIGTIDRGRIERHKRLGQFRESDFDLLLSLLAGSSGVVFTPHVLAETSNFLETGTDADKARNLAVLAEFAKTGEEIHVPASEAMDRSEYRWLGLTDAALLCCTSGGGVLLSVDGRLLHEAANLGVGFVPFDLVAAHRAATERL
jgi:hypothetical protein